MQWPVSACMHSLYLNQHPRVQHHVDSRVLNVHKKKKTSMFHFFEAEKFVYFSRKKSYSYFEQLFREMVRSHGTHSIKLDGSVIITTISEQSCVAL